MTLHPVTTVVRDTTVWTGGDDPTLLGDCDVLIEDGRIAALESRYTGRADQELDGSHCLTVPGLINAHTHAGATPTSRGVSEDLALPEDGAFYHSLVSLLTLASELLTAEEYAAVMEWDAAAMLLGGATTIVEESFGGHDTWISLVERLGFRSYLGTTYPGSVGAIGYVEDGEIVKDDPGDVAAGLAAALRLHDAFDGHCDGRLRIHLSPHATDTVPAEVLRASQREADARGIGMHLHVAQHLSEVQAIRDRHGVSPVRFLDDLGFLGPNVLATHVTFVDDDDMRIMARSGASVVHCAYRKAKEGIASPFWDYVQNGANVALATDSFSHDLVEDVKLAAVIGKVRRGAVDQPVAEAVLRCATHGAARALGRDDLGRIAPGACGDVLVLDLGSPYTAPVFHPVRAAVYYASRASVRHTVVAGRPIVQDRQLIGVDLASLRKRTELACRRLWERAADEGALPTSVPYPSSTCVA